MDAFLVHCTNLAVIYTIVIDIYEIYHVLIAEIKSSEESSLHYTIVEQWLQMQQKV